MKFTDRYIKVPCILIDGNDDEALQKEDIDAVMSFNPMSVDYYHADTYSKDEFDFKCTAVVMKSGAKFVVNVTVAEFEKRCNEF